MSDENADVPTPEPTPDPGKGQAGTLLSEVAGKIAQSGPQVREQVINLLVTREINSRAELLEKGLAKRSELSKDLRKKEKADIVAYDQNGKSVSESYSKAALDELKKAREQFEKIEKALDKALTEADYGKLRELVNK